MSTSSPYRSPAAISIAAGLLSLALSPLAIHFTTGDVVISIAWSLFFPLLAAIAFGPRCALLASAAGGSLFPFLLWPNNGWANLLTAVLFTVFFAGVGRLSRHQSSLRARRFYLGLLRQLIWFLPLMTASYVLVFPLLLRLNPPFWNADMIGSIPRSVLFQFAVKDGFNLVFATIGAETMLRLPIIRRLLGKRILPPMKQNTMLMATAGLIASLLWGLFFLMDRLLINDIALSQRVYIPLALLLIAAGFTITARALMSFSEKMHITNASLAGSEKRLKKAVHEKNVVLRELYHRTKNNMQTISSLISLRTVESSREVQEIFRDIENQIAAMSLVHSKLYQTASLSAIPMEDYIHDLCDLITESFGNLRAYEYRIDVDEITLPLSTAIHCGLILNELLTNTFKYAFSNGKSAVISIRMGYTDSTNGSSEIELRYHDNGRGLPPDYDIASSSGIGLNTVYALAEGQLRGRIHMLHDNGLGFVIRWHQAPEAKTRDQQR